MVQNEIKIEDIINYPFPIEVLRIIYHHAKRTYSINKIQKWYKLKHIDYLFYRELFGMNDHIKNTIIRFVNLKYNDNILYEYPHYILSLLGREPIETIFTKRSDVIKWLVKNISSDDFKSIEIG